MRLKNVTILRELLVTQLNHWALYPIVLTFTYLAGNGEGVVGNGVEPPVLGMWILCSLIPFLLYLTRQYVSQFALSVGIHVLMVGITMLLPWSTTISHVLYVICGILYAAYSLQMRIRRDNMEDNAIMPVVVVLIGGAALYLYHYMGGTEWDNYYITLIIITMGLHFVNYYIEKYQNFLVVNESSAGQIPATEIFRSGMSMVLLYTGLVVAVLALTANVEWLGSLLGYLQRAIKHILQALFNIYPEESDMTITQEEKVQGTGAFPMDVETPAWAWIWDVLMYIAYVALGIALLAGAVWLIARLTGYIKQNWNVVSTKKTITEGSVQEVREKCEIIRQTKDKKRNPFAFLSVNERIRKTYKKQVLAAHKRSGAEEEAEKLIFHTARHLGTKYDLQESARIYEKARYSGEECDASELKSMKSAAKA